MYFLVMYGNTVFLLDVLTSRLSSCVLIILTYLLRNSHISGLFQSLVFAFGDNAEVREILDSVPILPYLEVFQLQFSKFDHFRQSRCTLECAT